MVKPAQIIRYIESSLDVTQGDHVGEPFKVLPWEARFIRGAWTVEGDSAVSVGRGNGKSGLVSAIARAHLPAGPLAQRRGEVTVVASSFSQGKIIFEDVLSWIDRDDRRTWRIQDSQNAALIEHRDTGARVRVIGSDPRRAHGLRSALFLCDEPAQWEPQKAEKMVAAIRTSLGKMPGSRAIWLGTRPASDGHFFSKILESNADYSQVHAATRNDPKFAKRTLRKANPSFDHLPTLQARLAKEAGEAKRDPALLPAWEALRLNLGTSDVLEALLLDADTWRAIEGDASIDGPCHWGIDLGTSAAQSAIAAYWPQSGRLDVLAAFPNEPSLGERGLRDGVGNLYQLCERRGELIQTGGQAVNLGELLKSARQRFGVPGSISCDRWREAELRDALMEVKLFASIDLRGQGFKDGGEDVRAFRRACLEGKVTPSQSLLMRSAMGEARTVGDPAGNHKLAKKSEGGRRQLARDDAAAAAILAVSSGTRRAALAGGKLYYGAV